MNLPCLTSVFARSPILVYNSMCANEVKEDISL